MSISIANQSEFQNAMVTSCNSWEVFQVSYHSFLIGENQIQHIRGFTNRESCWRVDMLEEETLIDYVQK